MTLANLAEEFAEIVTSGEVMSSLGVDQPVGVAGVGADLTE
jgi:hypothetical protein